MILAGAKVGLSKKDKSRNKQGKNKTVGAKLSLNHLCLVVPSFVFFA
jgi:hypothetical protein